MIESHITAGAYQGLTAQWSYDDFGNRTAANYSGTLADPSQAPPIPGSASATYNANNQAQSATPGPAPAYDSSGDGDVTNDGRVAPVLMVFLHHHEGAPRCLAPSPSN